jgi:hypothetical protein
MILYPSCPSQVNHESAASHMAHLSYRTYRTEHARKGYVVHLQLSMPRAVETALQDVAAL